MSEYQYYEFLAIDRPLTADEIAAVRSTSTRASISSTSFVNEYEWGSYHGDPNVLMERFYDAHLYLANWGTRRFMLRLPLALLDADVELYCNDETVFTRTKGDSIVLDFCSEDDEGYDDFVDTRGILSSLIGTRAELAAGDLRPLYIAWLAGLGPWIDDLDDSGLTAPPVPPGLKSLTASQEALADFLRVDPAVLAAAESESAPLTKVGDDPDDLGEWIATLPAIDKDRLLFRVLTGEGGAVRTEMLGQFRKLNTATEAGNAVSVHELTGRAAEIRSAAERKQAAEDAAREEERRKKQRLAVEARLRRVAADEPVAWQRVNEHIALTKVAEYDAAVSLLLDLRMIAQRENRLDTFRPLVIDLRTANRRKPSLIERLDKAGL
ncbi:hypothetical protein HH308_20090 [Gordonia sp. TBRC 11910]|uniref:Uncharacterized protein n=1 Tax=Gordonia asplenii TaxID=2725283 RepID=A0A848KXZ2_9ACTN|nr:hypothetical protein [Gordonia asplenii]NMO03520.1 hypothetical protein [Gordonia asplenii]